MSNPKSIMRNPIMNIQKQPPRSVRQKHCSQIMQQIYRGTPMSKCDFNKVSTSTEITL